MYLLQNEESQINQLLLDHSLDGIFAFDTKQRITEWNSAMERLTGLPKDDCLGCGVLEVFPFFTDLGEDQLVAKVLNGEQVLSKNRPFYFPQSDKQGYFEAHYTPVRHSGTVHGGLVIFRDITEQWQFDENLLQTAEKVKKAVGDRTSELRQVNQNLKFQLRQRRKFGYEAMLKNIELTDSIEYAQKIQRVILPDDEEMRESFPKMFTFFKPKDIVSGDFYWYRNHGNKSFIAAVDCTGHGVPGALISMLGYNYLNQVVAEYELEKPSDILDKLNEMVTQVFTKRANNSIKDGMDISLCCFNHQTYELEYAGAYNPLHIISDGRLSRIKGNRFSIGINITRRESKFDNHSIQLKKGDCFYLLTDGFADQFGGPYGKKFKQRRLKEAISEVHKKAAGSMPEQGRLLRETLQKWQGDLDQVDDVLMIGVEV